MNRFVLAFLILFATGCTHTEKIQWYRGNLHTHSLWSDGDDYPEMIVDWYKEQGYHFLALSDHNTLAEGERWISVNDNAGGRAAFDKYVERWGDDWVDMRQESDKQEVRLKTLAEYRTRFEETGKFLVLQAEEITDGYDGKPLHVNASNIQQFVQPRGGSSVREVLQNNVDAVLEQRERTGIPMIPHVNHPNFGWAVEVEDLVHLRGEQFFEVYNGHPAVHNEGDAERPGTERMWDIILASRLAVGLPVMFGLAVDDSHHYHEMAIGKSNAGRGWIMVDTPELTPNAVIRALEEGSFYASSGVYLQSVAFRDQTLSIEIQPEPGIMYQTLFIGTKEGATLFEEKAEMVGERRHTRRVYTDQIGEVLSRSSSLNPSYELSGDELYVRAVVISTKEKVNGSVAGEVEKAWVQPVTRY